MKAANIGDIGAYKDFVCAYDSEKKNARKYLFIVMWKKEEEENRNTVTAPSISPTLMFGYTSSFELRKIDTK